MVRLRRPAIQIALEIRLPLRADRIAPTRTNCLWMRACAGRLLLTNRSLLSLAKYTT
jgi:hypothetical protein